MDLPRYRIRINGRYLCGWDESRPVGRVGHMGWQPRAVEMPAMVLTRDRAQARIVEGNIELKSQFERIYDRARYAGLELMSLEIERVVDG